MYSLQPPQQPQVGARYTVTTGKSLSSVAGRSVAAALQALSSSVANKVIKIILRIIVPLFSFFDK
jgi:hypothetical protein